MTEPGMELELGDDAAWIAAAIVFVAAFGGAVVLAEWPLLGVEPAEPEEPHLVEPNEGGTELWPYTSRRRSYAGRTLGINMVFYGDADRIHTALTQRSDLEWYDQQPQEAHADSETVAQRRIEIDPEAGDVAGMISWTDAGGSKRYTYFETDERGVWADESYQLHSGTYLGQRRHIRAYEEPNGEWTAVQIHEEHWDWFRLRHTVTGISDSQRELELEFMDKPYVETVVRMPFDNATADSDGWVTGIRLAGAALPLFFIGLVGIGVGRPQERIRSVRRFLRRRRREIALSAGLFALFTAVRWLGIAGEILLPKTSPKLLAAPLYLALVVGIPGIAYRFGKRSNRGWAFTFAALGLGAAIVVDFAAMGVSVVPLRVILHRGAILLAVGLLAIGAALTREEDPYPAPLVVGSGGWVLSVVAPLFGYV